MIRRRAALWVVPAGFLGLFYAWPLLRILSVSFARAEAGPAAAAAAALGAATTRRVILFTFEEAALSTFLTLAIGLPGAYLIARVVFPGKKVLRALTAVPFVLPTLVVAAAFEATLGPPGLLGGLGAHLGVALAPWRHGLGAILVAHAFYNTAIVLRLVGDAWSHLDPTLAEAARVLGASRVGVLRRVTGPLLAPAVAAAAALVFLFCFTSFGVVLVLGGLRYATLEVEIYTQTVALFNLPAAATLSLVQLAFTMAVMAVYTRLAERATRPMRLRPSGSGARPPRTRVQRALVAVAVGGLFLFLTLPLVALALRSLSVVQPSGQRVFTLDYYRALAANPTESAFAVSPAVSIAVSLAYAVAATALALGAGLPAAWSLVRGPSRVRAWLDPALLLPLGTSAVTLGLGYLVAFNQPPLSAVSWAAVVPAAHALVAFPFVVRSLVPALGALQPSLREAAAVLGASPRQVVRHVEAPLVGRALVVAGGFAFLISLGEFGATAILANPRLPTMPVAIERLLARPGALHYGQAMALATLLMATTAFVMLAMEHFRFGKIGEF